MLSAWQIEDMVASKNSELWEELNADDPYSEKLEEAAESMKTVDNGLYAVENSISEAMAILYDSPMECELESYLNEIDDIRLSLKKLIEAYGKGERR